MIAALVGLAFLMPATVAAGYYLILATIGWGQRWIAVGSPPRHSFAVLIPAHNEGAGLAITLHSVREIDYPTALVHVLVIADNCTDDTAAVARANGAECLERCDLVHRGKGFALAYGIPAALARGVDVVMVLDSDCSLAANTLRELDAAISAGAMAVQAAVIARNAFVRPAGLVSAVGSEIDNAVSAGRDRFGGHVALRGTGMAFRRAILERFPWQSFGITEDAEYSGVLRAAGVRTRFVASAVVMTDAPPTTAALCTQRRRWRAALFTTNGNLMHRMFESKPLLLAHLILTCGIVGAISPILPPEWGLGFALWLASLLLATGAVYLRAILRSGVHPESLAEVVESVGVVGRLAMVTAAGVWHRERRWRRTPRTAEVRS